jgi:dihydrofolate synthase/folylpolyglutamate synthase
MGFFPDTRAVIGMLRDKDMEGVCRALAGRITHWYAASLQGPRAASAEDVAAAIARSGAGGQARCFDSPRAAYAAALGEAAENDRIVVFGSFLTVAEIIAERAGA